VAVDQPDHTAHRIRVVDLEGVMQGEGVDVDDRGVEPRVGEEAHLRLDEVALGRDEQDAHLHAVAIRIEDLEVQLDRLHVEGDVLLRLPSHEFACLLLLHALDLDLLDDDVASADGGDDVLGLEPRLLDGAADGIGDDARIHDLAFDDGVGEQRRDHDLGEFRFATSVIDDRDLDEPRADVEADRRLPATEERHNDERVRRRSWAPRARCARRRRTRHIDRQSGRFCPSHDRPWRGVTAECPPGAPDGGCPCLGRGA
jgi:hypothetical protein